MVEWRDPSTAKSPLAKETTLADLTVVGEDIRFTLDEYTSAQTLTVENYLVLLNTSSGDITVTLPAAVNHKNRVYIIKNIGSGIVKIETTGTDKVEQEKKLVLGLEGDFVWITSDADEWHIIGGRNVKLEDLVDDLLTELKDQKEKLREELVHIRLHQEKMSNLETDKRAVRLEISQEDPEG